MFLLPAVRSMNKVGVSLQRLLLPCERLLTSRQLISSSCVLYKKQKRKSPQLKLDCKLVYTNPIDRLKDLLQVPLFKEGEEIFSPPLHTLKEGEQLFVPKKGHTIEYLQGALYRDQLPEEIYPEVAFAGRSNVGKSSLIKALFSHEPDVVVRTSKTPGQTKILNFFNIGRSFRIVDMPGYGENMPKSFVQSSEQYLLHRKRLKRAFLLIDGAEGVTKVDRIGIDMMEEFALPYTVILTKMDKVSDHILLRNLMEFLALREQTLVHCFPQCFLVSSETGEGLALLQAYMGFVTGKLRVKGL